MGIREERLIGYQLINKINMGNEVLYRSSQILQKINPNTGQPLKVPGGTMSNPVMDQEPSIEDLKTLNNTNIIIVELEVEQRAKGFLDRYSNIQQITKGLQLFNTTLSDLNLDKDNIISDKNSIKSSVLSAINLSALETIGLSLENRTERVIKQVTPSNDLPLNEQQITIYQNLCNAIAFNLAGLSCYTGVSKHKTVADIKEIVEARIYTAELHWRNCPTTTETLNIQAVFNYVKQQLPLVNDLNNLSDLSEYVNSQVEQLPVVGRWWNY